MPMSMSRLSLDSWMQSLLNGCGAAQMCGILWVWGKLPSHSTKPCGVIHMWTAALQSTAVNCEEHLKVKVKR